MVFFYYSVISGSGIIYIFLLGYEFLPTSELELFVVKFLIRIICGEIFTNARVRGGIFTNARVGIIRDRIFTSVRVRNIINKSS